MECANGKAGLLLGHRCRKLDYGHGVDVYLPCYNMFRLGAEEDQPSLSLSVRGAHIYVLEQVCCARGTVAAGEGLCSPFCCMASVV